MVPQTGRLNPKIWGFPKILGAKDVWVKRPGGKKLEPMPNPLYAFNFPNEILKSKGRAPIDWAARDVVGHFDIHKV
jgi:hypothetical protein